MTDDVLAAVRARFDGRAAEYDRSEMHRELAAAVADFADLDGVRDVLDVATGTGLVLRALHSRDGALRLSGVDLSGGMVEVARAELPAATLVEGDATVLPFGDDAYDLVTCATGVHLFPDADAAIAEWVRVLRPEGCVVTATFGEVDPSQHGGRPDEAGAAAADAHDATGAHGAAGATGAAGAHGAVGPTGAAGAHGAAGAIAAARAQGAAGAIAAAGAHGAAGATGATAAFGAHAAGHHGAEPPPYPTHHERFRTPELLAEAVAPAGLTLTRHAWWTHGDDRILLAELRPA